MVVIFTLVLQEPSMCPHSQHRFTVVGKLSNYHEHIIDHIDKPEENSTEYEVEVFPITLFKIL